MIGLDADTHKKIKMKFVTKIICWILFPFLYLISTLPMAVLYKVSYVIFLILYKILHYRERVTVQNISRAFPDKKYNEIGSIEKKFYRNFADIFVETIKSVSILPREQKSKLDIKGFDFVKDQIEKGNSIIACLGHCANWEILNCLPSKIDADVYSSYKPMTTSIINKAMLDIRSRFGMHLITSRSTARYILSNRNKPSLYLLIADQCPKNVKSAYQITFLNQKTSVLSGPEKLAIFTGSAVIYIKLTRKERGHFEAECQPICENANNMQSLEITKKYTELLEQNIQYDPSCWLWTHKRWKR